MPGTGSQSRSGARPLFHIDGGGIVHIQGRGFVHFDSGSFVHVGIQKKPFLIAPASEILFLHRRLFGAAPKLGSLSEQFGNSKELKQYITSHTITSPSLHHHFIITSFVCLFIYAFYQACPTIH